MKKVNIQNINLDDGKDGLDFKMSLFNKEKYDKANFRTITTSTIVQLELTNTTNRNIPIKSIGLAIISDDETDSIYSPKIFEVASTLAADDTATFSFYAYEIKLIFGKTKREKGAFVINHGSNAHQYASTYIDGDRIEVMISDMETEDLGYNWSASDITRLNSMSSFNKATRQLKTDNSPVYTEMDIDKPGDALKISLAIFNDRIFTSNQKEVKSKTIAELKIENLSGMELDIQNPLLLIKDDPAKGMTLRVYSSSKLAEQFPIAIGAGDELSLFYDSESINDLLDDSIGEDVVFLVKDIYDNSYPTKKIEGDDIENAIAEHNEHASGITKREVFEFDLEM